MKILHNRIKSEKEAPNRRFPRRVPKKRLEGDLIMTTNSSPALVNVDTVPLPSPGRPLALTHHGCHVRVSCAGVICRCIVRVYRAYIVPACVGVHNACASASAGKKFFQQKTAPAFRAFTGRQCVQRKSPKASPTVNGLYLTISRISV